MLAMTRPANASASRPAAPLVGGSCRVREASTKTSSSACKGSTAGAGSFSNPNSGCGPGRFTPTRRDRKSTRLNSSHGYISYAVFCLKKKKYHVTTVFPLPYEVSLPIHMLLVPGSSDDGY